MPYSLVQAYLTGLTVADLLELGQLSRAAAARGLVFAPGADITLEMWLRFLAAEICDRASFLSQGQN